MGPLRQSGQGACPKAGGGVAGREGGQFGQLGGEDHPACQALGSSLEAE